MSKYFCSKQVKKKEFCKKRIILANCFYTLIFLKAQITVENTPFVDKMAL
jgi:hypothetical protein